MCIFPSFKSQCRKVRIDNCIWDMYMLKFARTQKIQMCATLQARQSGPPLPLSGVLSRVGPSGPCFGPPPPPMSRDLEPASTDLGPTPPSWSGLDASTDLGPNSSSSCPLSPLLGWRTGMKFHQINYLTEQKVVIQNNVFFEGVILKPSATPLPPEITTTDGKTSSSLHY